MGKNLHANVKLLTPAKADGIKMVFQNNAVKSEN